MAKTSPGQVDPTRGGHAERLSVPLRWWAQATMLVATLWLAMVVALPDALAWAIAGGLLIATAGALTSYGSARVSVESGNLHAGRAVIGLEHLGRAEALDPDATRRVAGRDANARAFLLLRPYLKRAVRVEVTDPADPTPYWLVATRRPEALARALTSTAGQPEPGPR